MARSSNATSAPGRHLIRAATRTLTTDLLTACIERDVGRDGGYTLVVDGTTQSHVDLREPRRLRLEYTQHMAAIVDARFPSNASLRILHLGAGALTMARYVGATRPGSEQHVVELHRELLDFVVDALPLARGTRVSVQFADARDAVAGNVPAHAGYDVVIVDVFAGSVSPRHLSTVEFFAAVDRLLAPGGVVLVNTIATASFDDSRAITAALAAVWPETLALVPAAVLQRIALGNVVVAASAAPLPAAPIAYRVAACVRPVTLLHGAELADFVGGATPRRDRDR